jgi:hypothetical protein
VRRLPILALAALLLSALLAAAPGAVQAQTAVQDWDQVNVTATIGADGAVQIREELGYRFRSGSFNGSFRDIPTTRLGAIQDVTVEEAGSGAYRADATPFDLGAKRFGPPRTFQVVSDGEARRIIWFYEPLVAPAHKTMVVSYVVTGVIRSYPDGDGLWWSPFLPDRKGSIDQAHMTVEVPPGVDLTAPGAHVVLLPGGRGQVDVTPRTATFTVPDALPPSLALEVQIRWPHGAIPGAPPPWQVAADAAREARGRRDLSVVVGSLLLFVLGCLFWLWRFYSPGRDSAARRVDSTLTDPPSDLPPGLVGVLVGATPDVRDVIATVLDLGRRGNLRITEHDNNGTPDFAYVFLHGATLKPIKRARAPHRFPKQTRAQPDKTILPFEKEVLAALFDDFGSPVRLSQLQGRFRARLPAVYREMTAAVTALGLFPADADAVAPRYRRLATGFLVLGVLAFFAAVELETSHPYLLSFALWIPGVIGLFLAGRMPRTTAAGAEAAARWRAYGRYLADLQRFGDISEAARRLGDALPYAVALGVERKYTKQFADVPAAVTPPDYYVPLGGHGAPEYASSGHDPASGSTPASAGAAGPADPDRGRGGSVPTATFNPTAAVNAANANLTGMVNGLNSSLTVMVNVAAGVFVSAPHSTGGFWGGGDSSSGGSGGSGQVDVGSSGGGHWGGGSSGGGWGGGGGGGEGSSSGGGGGGSF